MITPPSQSLNPSDAELFIGIVAWIGVDTTAVVDTITEELKEYDYKTYNIHLTKIIKAFTKKISTKENPVEERYSSYIKACNTFREECGADSMSRLAITDVQRIRTSKDKDGNDLQKRRAFIINQIKRPEEAELLRKVYGEQYIQISCHADEQVRIDNLRKKISKDHFLNPKNPKWDVEARNLVSIDEEQEDEKYGQRVRKVFPTSDVIIDVNNTKKLKDGIERFLRLLFGDKSITPTQEEYGMELASTAAIRSSDLSRQVGAAILNKHMEIQALGCNEVPKFGGGTYWANSPVDGRDFKLGHDSNEQRRHVVLMDLIYRLKEANALSEKLTNCDHKYLENFIFDRNDKLISDSQMMDSLEYGRSVHAEMNAITDAARGGHAIRNCILFTNTFPCHNCAKHIVSSGIEEVFYLHPYPKSYAKELFCDSIEINPPTERTCPPIRVGFKQFVGIQGPIYTRLFTKTKWKTEDGKIKDFVKKDASYIRTTPIPSYKSTEDFLLYQINDQLRSKGYL
ncbi:zinc-binding CMP/dCMP deaminase [Komagataeibacter diospyri]|uniref:anti-phage dCTP deaminase n=1 Tax=Komagataeibacter diospyri TaxID=1932662 RepID=UPI001139C438|nr:anti-phage dCTP deaminase [Komagataeibacter diospyri]GCE89857.1 zinc-binding CMP/dCMP deaminase [Komagataeibacter diospyri]